MAKEEGRGLPQAANYLFARMTIGSNEFHIAQAPTADLTQPDQPISCTRAAINRALKAKVMAIFQRRLANWRFLHSGTWVIVS